jgi:uncharacterized Ntn-hydrolase superfamily protein
MTYSIVAYDPTEGAWGVGVASKFLAVGAVVSWARAGAGAVATQSFCKMGFGPDGLAMMAEGKSAQETLDALLANDQQASMRQVGVVDAQGGSAAHSGGDCFEWKGHKLGEGFTCQGNILTGGNTLDAMAETFSSASGELADRLVAALLAGDTVGGDKRGKQGAAVLVVKANGGYGGDTDRYLDLRVDDDPEPVQKLSKLVGLHHLYFGAPLPQDQLPITPDIARELQSYLRDQGYSQAEPNGVWDDTAKQTFWAMVGSENLEERWNLERDTNAIDRLALNYLRQEFGNG